MPDGHTRVPGSSLLPYPVMLGDGTGDAGHVIYRSEVLVATLPREVLIPITGVKPTHLAQ